MSTKIPPHNLKEICQAVINQIDNPNITIEELMEYVKGPDFPTGAMIMGVDGIESAYKTGKGSIIVRGVTEVITKKGKTTIIVKEIPYQVSPEKLVKDIRDIQDDWDNYVKERAKKNSKAKPKGLDFVVKDGVHNLTDKTNKNDTVTIEIELKKNVEPELVLNYLYKHTDLQSSFPMNNLSLVPRTVTKGNKTTRILEPKTLTLKETLAEYIKHQIEVETRKLQYELRKAQERMHRIEGIIKALNKLDETIETIRNAQDTNTARVELIKLLEIDEIQANAILELRLQKLTSFDQDKQREEHKELQTTIDKINEKLSNVELIKNDIKASLQEIIERYGNDRRTEICPPAEDFNAEDLISDDEVVVTLTQNGFIKRTLESTYRTQRRKGIGVNAMSMYEDDFIRHLHVAKNRDTLLFFTNIGRVYRKKVWEIQEAARESRGQNIKLLLELEENEKVQALLTVREFSDEQYLFFATQKGIVKKSKLSDYAHIRRNGIAAITLDNVDRLVGVALTNGDRNITLVTKNGLSITFQEEEVRTVGRTGRGVKGIDLKEKDVVISFSIHEEDGDLFIATNSGYGKRTPLSDFRVQTRGGKGVICTKLTDKNGEVVGSEVVQEDDNLMLITKNGTLMRIRVSEISKFGRNTQGTKIMNLRGSDDLRAIARIADTDDDEEIEAEVDSE
jgi:DNA gyrase subunit A